jgi:peptide/nickel transport system substrate-binding protein
MKRFFIFAVILFATAALAIAGSTAEDDSGGMAAAGEPLGLYPQYWQFADLDEMEDVTGIRLTEFGESPQLAARVAAGELPPVEDRLPKQPLVVVRNEIGTYGGTLQTAHEGTATGLVLTVYKFDQEFPGTWDPDVTEVRPNWLREIEVVGDASEYIWHMREGMKWSDGAPMTADDVMFWYEAEALNEELRPGGVRTFMVLGEMGVAQKIDDYTVKWSLAGPNGYWVQQHGILWPPLPLPEHYLSEFHPDYASESDLADIIAEEGFSDWLTLWNAKATSVVHENPEMPNNRAWIVLTDGMAPVNRMIRNPYYWKIDTAGNQLPYIDEIESVLIDRDAMKLSVIAGEIDYITGELLDLWSAETYALLKEREADGNYIVKTSRGIVNNIGAFNLNLTHGDPFYRELFNEKDFRVALSIGIDRDEINDTVMRGSGIPSQVGPTYKEEGWSDTWKVYTEYDPDEANRLLDGLGLEWNGNRTARLRPDGDPIQIVALIETWRIGAVEMTEMYTQYWADLGLKIIAKPMEPNAKNFEWEEGRYEMRVGLSSAGHPMESIFEDDRMVPLVADSWVVDRNWGLWATSGGEEGEEPPTAELQADIKRLWELRGMFFPESDAAKREAMIDEAMAINLKHLWTVGGMNANPDLTFNPYNKGLRNVVGVTYAWSSHVPAAWFFEGGSRQE